MNGRYYCECSLLIVSSEMFTEDRILELYPSEWKQTEHRLCVLCVDCYLHGLLATLFAVQPS